ncbi:hypothetical protein N7450_005215 [Penicillium hetheringtonii]|uniref:Calcineurin-like phosphoesterase domain-containing protein n=1 Tax=Penicillium hetheringtonii TaxID=911720 RepID=A0AAD6DRH0_9EURO|nr:hypothetical protein N7450_005215 [Penicillium hetheringtonii]
MQAVLGFPSFVNDTISLPGAASYVAAAGFPTSAFECCFPYELTNPDIIPENSDEAFFPVPNAMLRIDEKHALLQEVMANVSTIISSETTTSKGNCNKCKLALAAAKKAALYVPQMVPEAIVQLCKNFSFESNESCESSYARNTFGPTWTQVLAYADVEGLDGEYICNNLNPQFCPSPHAQPLKTSSLFPKPKPANPSIPKASGKRVKVLHMSDLHLDARFGVSSEANCTSGLCCRVDSYNRHSMNKVTLPASPYGSFHCDSPYDLALAAVQAVGPLTGTGKRKGACGDKESLAFTIYTGDLESHDPAPQNSRRYLEYIETAVFDMFKRYLTGPVFVTLGNHDSVPADIDATHGLPGRLGKQMSWNYKHVSGLWEHEGWISHETAKEAETHYGGYSVLTHHGLRIISLNTRHILAGWDGYNAMPDPTNLFYQIVERYSPHVIANIFFGHTHEDQFNIYYADNGTIKSTETALNTAWIGPSVTPLTNMNSGFRMYEIDTGDFNIYEAYTFYSNVSEYPGLRNRGPTYRFEYSTRETYGSAAEWPEEAPLNATFWHRVTEGMEKDLSLVSLHNFLQGKMSMKSPECTTEECQRSKICYMRSGSTPLGYLCKQGYGSVQSPFTAV